MIHILNVKRKYNPMRNQKYEFGEIISLYSGNKRIFGVIIKIYWGTIEDYYDVYWFNAVYARNYTSKSIEFFKKVYEQP